MSEWQPIETAPKDGTRFLAFGRAIRELVENKGERWITHDTEDRERFPLVLICHWVEGWYNKEIDNGDGTYRKERTQGYAYFGPQPQAFTPEWWMPLPEAPDEAILRLRLYAFGDTQDRGS